MAITLSGIRVNTVHIDFDVAGGEFKIQTAEYSLMSSAGKVLAKQAIGGYQGLVLEPSAQTKAALDAFMRSYSTDVQTLLGLLDA